MGLKTFVITDCSFQIVGYLVADDKRPHEIPWKRFVAKQHKIHETDIIIGNIKKESLFVVPSLIATISGTPIDVLYPEIGGSI